MAILQVKRRHSGAAGAPTNLKPGEMAFNDVDGRLYIGKGAAGADGFAPNVVPVADEAVVADAVTKTYVDNAVSNVASVPTVGTGLSLLSDNSIALADNVALTGIPTAPTPADNDNSEKIATTSFVMREMLQMIGVGQEDVETIRGIVAHLNQNDDARQALANAVAAKIDKDQNLNDLADKALARGNLGLSDMAEQAANAVNITGGTIGAGVTIVADIDGGTF